MVLPVPVAVDRNKVGELVRAHPLPELPSFRAVAPVPMTVGASAWILERDAMARVRSHDAVGADEDTEIRIALQQCSLEPLLLLCAPNCLRRAVRIRIG